MRRLIKSFLFLWQIKSANFWKIYLHISLKLVSFHSWFRFIISPANIAIFYCLVLATNWLDTHLHSKTFVGKTVRIMMIGRRSSGVQSTFKLNQIYAKEIVFKIRTPNQQQVAKIVPYSKLVSNIEKSNQIFNFSLF